MLMLVQDLIALVLVLWLVLGVVLWLVLGVVMVLVLGVVMVLVLGVGHAYFHYRERMKKSETLRRG